MKFFEKILIEEYLEEAPLASKGWTDKSVAKFGKTIGKDPTEKGFMKACISRMENKEGFDKKKAAGFCASIKDKSYNSTYWRGSGKTKKEVESDVKSKQIKEK